MGCTSLPSYEIRAARENPRNTLLTPGHDFFSLPLVGRVGVGVRHCTPHPALRRNSAKWGQVGGFVAFRGGYPKWVGRRWSRIPLSGHLHRVSSQSALLPHIHASSCEGNAVDDAITCIRVSSEAQAYSGLASKPS